MSQPPPPTYSNLKDTGKYTHPWIKALPPGRARLYDLLYKTTSSVLLGFACYGLFETTRGAWYIHAGNQKAVEEAEAARAAAARQ
mmetsp:Transcript_6439/g.17205  ORF Transcript_6439/g.17205 Transcript_6439/m.17205 type:complete len:85 (+) Transcript_6439:117-371(+)